MGERRSVPLPCRAVGGVSERASERARARLGVAFLMLWGALVVGGIAVMFLESGDRCGCGRG